MIAVEVRPFLALVRAAPPVIAAVVAPSAWALTCADVQQLLDAGAPEAIIVSTIENATPPLTAVDVACLALDARVTGPVEAAASHTSVPDRSASFGTADGSTDGSTATATISDPEIASWITKMQDRVAPNWHPLISTCQANPTLTVVIRVPRKADGTLSEDPTVSKSSGDSSLDQSALMAVRQTGGLPPLPGVLASGLDANVVFRCSTLLSPAEGHEPTQGPSVPLSGSGRVGDWSYSLPRLGEVDSSEAKTTSKGEEFAGDLRVECFRGDLGIQVWNLGLTASEPRTDISFDGRTWETLRHDRVPAEDLRALISHDVLYVRWVTRLGMVNDTFSLVGSAAAVGAVAAACQVTP